MKSEGKKSATRLRQGSYFPSLNDDQETDIALNPQGPQGNRNMYVIKKKDDSKENWCYYLPMLEINKNL